MTREQMVEWATQHVLSLGQIEESHTRAAITTHFDVLFVHETEGYAPHWPESVREMLITWEPHR